MVSWKLLLFWAVRPKWAVTERLFIAKPLISCHDGSEANAQYHCMGETSFWMDFKLWCITESNSLPSSKRTAVGAHPPCWKIKTEAYFWSYGKANTMLRAAAGMLDHSIPHLCCMWYCITFLRQKGTPLPLAWGNRYEAWDMSSTKTVFSFEIINAALDWDFAAQQALLITQSNPPDSMKLSLSACLKPLPSGEAMAHLLERQLVHIEDFEWQRIHRALAIFSPAGNMECFFLA